jgi:hypothetical protein
VDDRPHLSPALYARSEAYDPDEAYTATEEEQRDTLPSPPKDEESPESDGKPQETVVLTRLHLDED